MSNSYIVGPGTLTFSSPELELSAQVTKCEVKPSVKADDPIHVLSGSTIGGNRDYTATLDVTVLQDLVKAGIIDFSWNNAGKEVTFTYTPNTKDGAKIAGKCIVDPITVGGEVKKRATSDFSWECLGLPTFTPKATR
ncbi:hypothetical protein ACL1CX_11070 [Corynebacterium striatum]